MSLDKILFTMYPSAGTSEPPYVGRKQPKRPLLETQLKRTKTLPIVIPSKNNSKKIQIAYNFLSQSV